MKKNKLVSSSISESSITRRGEVLSIVLVQNVETFALNGRRDNLVFQAVIKCGFPIFGGIVVMVFCH